MLKTKSIAVFDSGIGGLTVYKQLKQVLPNENYIYFGDLKNSPYGEKTKEQLISYTKDIFNFFKLKNVKAVVMACNTTSAVVYEDLKNEYPFKIYPIIQSVAEVISKLPINNLGIFATQATVQSGVYSRSINEFNPNIAIKEIATPAWVKIVENKKQNEELSQMLIKESLDKMLTFNPDKIVLGCTHYPYLLEVLSKFASRELFLDPARAFAEFIKKDLIEKDLINQDGKGFEEFFVSANAEQFKTSAQMFYELENVPELIEFRTV